MKKRIETLKLEKLTIARIAINELIKIQGGSSDPTDPDPTAPIYRTREMCI
jgi:hypothetical protein